MNIKLVRTFVPSKDFEQSIQYYKDLGFQQLWKGEDLCEMGTKEVNFFVQKYYVKEYAENFMMQLFVDDLEALYDTAKKLTEKYKETKVQPIFTAEYGKTFHVIDPTGVLWHMTEVTKQEGNRADLLCDDEKKTDC